MLFSSSRRRGAALISACALAISLAGVVRSPADAATLPAPLTGQVLLPDGSPAVGATVTLNAETNQGIPGGEGTDGFLVGTGVTDASGNWRILPLWPSELDDPVYNPDGSVFIDAQAVSADGTWSKLFNFNIMEPAEPGLSATVPEDPDSDYVSGSAGGDVTGVNLSFAGVTETAPETPNPLAPVETDVADDTAYDVAAADDGDETGANAGKAPKKTCDKVHHVCYITGDPGPCRSSEPVSGWRNMPGDANTEKRWVPVQPIRTTAYGHEHYTFENGKTTQMSIAYGGAGQNYAGGLAYSTKNATDGGNDAKAGTYFVGYFNQQWVFRKQRQWCVGQDPVRIAYNDLRDSGRRRFRPEQWLGGLARKSATMDLWACHDAYALKIDPGQHPWVTRSSVITWKGYFSLFGVALKSKTEDNSSHSLELFVYDTTKFCPDSSTSVYHADRVREE
jgi:hypothetical protein